MNEAQQAIHQALAGIPSCGDWPAEAYRAIRLGGLTNLVYRIDHDNDRYVLRLPGPGTEQYIDRVVEMHNARVAAAAGVSAPVVHADAETGVLLCRYIDDSVTMTPAEFRRRDGAAARAGRALRQMHDWPAPFQFRFELFAMIDEYRALLKQRNAQLPAGYAEMVQAAQPVRAALDRHPVKLAPCHCDPLCENFLDTGERMWVVDWEYSGMNDPMWDLGDLSVEGEFTPAQDLELMRAYCGGEPAAADMGRMVIYKAMCDLLWTLWGLIQHSDANPAEDFWAYSVARFERCQALMNAAEFERHLSAVDSA